AILAASASLGRRVPRRNSNGINRAAPGPRGAGGSRAHPSGPRGGLRRSPRRCLEISVWTALLAWTFRGLGDRMKRILLFVATNVAVLVVLSVVMQLLGVESLLAEQGTELDLQALLIFSAVIGSTGSFISLAMSKWTA